MKSLKFALVLGLISLSLPLAAQAETTKIDGIAAIAAGAINPPDPVEGCSKAKRDAEDKAVKAGTKGLVSWDKLSVDSDCKLTTPGATGVGYFYIFTARGNFTK